MSRAIALIGDKSDHGGVIITGDPFATVNGIPVARVGDLHACPQYNGDTPHAVKPIILTGCGSTRGFVKGRIMAIAFDKTGCGATLLPSQQLGSSKC
jgi:uncharacterized Zn-binding protein involved in type VI secretion